MQRGARFVLCRCGCGGLAMRLGMHVRVGVGRLQGVSCAARLLNCLRAQQPQLWRQDKLWFCMFIHPMPICYVDGTSI